MMIWQDNLNFPRFPLTCQTVDARGQAAAKQFAAAPISAHDFGAVCGNAWLARVFAGRAF
jgi:hypothetical protein